MLISRNWLQSHFETELPSSEKIAETLMMHSFELEGIEEKENDTIIDIDVLPNRAHDCLSHAGVAKEYSVLTGYELIKQRYHYHDAVTHNENTIKVENDSPDQCYRYMARIINNIEVAESPQWLRDRIESIGQRSINNIVDATNYVMFDIGNPMHAFDADKIEGGITVRNAVEGETLVILGGEEIVLKSHDLVIADDAGVLALAGVKGGVKAEVTKDTKNIVIEVANFNPATTRTTARRVKILTDSSKRFENGISSEIAPIAMEAISRLITDCMPGESIGPVVDVYTQNEEEVVINVSCKHINSLLGLNFSTDEIQEILAKMDYQTHLEGEIFSVHVPPLRIDLRIAEDIIEEIGRVYGYHNIPVKNLDDYNFTPRVHSGVYVENTLKNLLTNKGFSELKNYSFVKKGDVVMKNPIASNKGALRKNLYKGMLEALEKNYHNIDFFGSDRTAIFEIGRVYTKDTEIDLCCIAIANKNKQSNKKYGTERVQLEALMEDINQEFGVSLDPNYEKNSVSFDMRDCYGQFDSYGNTLQQSNYEKNAEFHSVSAFPYMTRDISLWSPENTTEKELRDIIKKTKVQYLRKVFLFDRFEKEGRVSYAFSLIFQSDEKTLNDEEVANDMMLIENSLIQSGCEIR